jgi:hypothetical protein
MSAFDFARQLRESSPQVQRVVRWLQTRKDVFYAADVQDDPAYFYRGDILYVPDSVVQHIEMKIETRTSSETPNLAIERYSDLQRTKIGGPWGTRAEWYAHLYADGLMVMMRRPNLTQWLTPQLNTLPSFQANNKTWLTTGVLVPRVRVQLALAAHYREYRISMS